MIETFTDFHKLLLDKSRYGILACDNNYQVTYINQRVYEIHGVEIGEDPNTWEEYAVLLEADGITPTPKDKIPLVRALGGEKVRDAYHVLRYKNRSSVLIKYNSEPLYDENGKQIGAILTSEDSEDLAATLARFQTIFLQSPLSIQIFSKEGKTLLVNKSFQELWSIPDEFLNNYILNTYNILEDELLIKSGEIELIRKAFKGEIVQIKPFYYDPSQKGFPGRARWAGGLVYPLKNTMGEVQELVIIHQDMTDQRVAEGEKEKLYSQLEAILRQMPAGIMVADTKGKVSIFNEQMMSLIGDPEQALKTFAEPLNKSLMGEVIRSNEVEFNIDAARHIVSTSSGPIHDNEGRITAGVLIAKDVTLEKRIVANQAFLTKIKSLLVATLDYNTIINQIAEAVIPYLADACMIDIVEGDTYKRLVSRHFCIETEELMREATRLFPLKQGYPLPSMRAIETGNAEFRHQYTDEQLRKITYDEDHFQIIKKIGVRSLISIPLQVRGKTLGGITFLVTNEKRSLFDDIDLDLAKSIARNISITIENARLFRDANSAIQLRDDFISMASHELRTPITSMNLQIEVLKSIAEGIQKDSETSRLMNKFLDSTKNQLMRLTTLVDDMLDISRINSGNLKITFKTINLRRIVMDVIDRFDEQLKSQNISLELFCKEDVLCPGDADRLDQVITNFMTNAIRYGKRQPIHIYLEENSCEVVFKIQDFGRGVAKKDKERIFKRFERTHTSEDVSGLGLGLYINKQIIDEHQGQILLESEPGVGSTFIVKLPKSKS